jgi:hypothetical protein
VLWAVFKPPAAADRLDANRGRWIEQIPDGHSGNKVSAGTHIKSFMQFA